MALSLYYSFLAAAAVLAIIPGPGILFVLAQTSKGGRSAGVSASVGTAIGGLFHVLAGAVGISAIVYSSAVAFNTVKILGAFYLFYLGWRALRENRSMSASVLKDIQLESESLKQGIITEALNPKTALFFLALIPQFIDPNSNVALQFVILGTSSVLLNTLMDLVVVLGSNYFISLLRRSNIASKSFRYISAVGYFGLGLMALRSGRDTQS